MIKLLDHGYIKLIDVWGSDERIIESARMSTDKGFEGWERDEKLLSYLYKKKHMTPFEMCGLTVEVYAPIMVYREWHRHRTQSYNEMSARYVPLPDVNYVPTRERIIEGAKLAANNRQAQGLAPLDEGAINTWLAQLDLAYGGAELLYQNGLALGIPKELARLIVPVGRYSRMRASANLRNWLGFATLRSTAKGPDAQHEIRVYADALVDILAEQFPRTTKLFLEG